MPERVRKLLYLLDLMLSQRALAQLPISCCRGAASLGRGSQPAGSSSFVPVEPICPDISPGV